MVAGEEAVEVVPRGSRVECDEGIGDVLAGEIDDQRFAAGMGFDPIGDVVDFALDRDPEVSGFVVFAQIFFRNVLFLRLFRH